MMLQHHPMKSDISTPASPRAATAMNSTSVSPSEWQSSTLAAELRQEEDARAEDKDVDSSRRPACRRSCVEQRAVSIVAVTSGCFAGAAEATAGRAVLSPSFSIACHQRLASPSSPARLEQHGGSGRWGLRPGTRDNQRPMPAMTNISAAKLGMIGIAGAVKSSEPATTRNAMKASRRARASRCPELLRFE